MHKLYFQYLVSSLVWFHEVNFNFHFINEETKAPEGLYNFPEDTWLISGRFGPSCSWLQTLPSYFKKLPHPTVVSPSLFMGYWRGVWVGQASVPQWEIGIGFECGENRLLARGLLCASEGMFSHFPLHQWGIWRESFEIGPSPEAWTFFLVTYKPEDLWPFKVYAV